MCRLPCCCCRRAAVREEICLHTGRACRLLLPLKHQQHLHARMLSRPVLLRDQASPHGPAPHDAVGMHHAGLLPVALTTNPSMNTVMPTVTLGLLATCWTPGNQHQQLYTATLRPVMGVVAELSTHCRSEHLISGRCPNVGHPAFAMGRIITCTPLQGLHVLGGGRLEVCIGTFQPPHALFQQGNLSPQLGFLLLPPVLCCLHCRPEVNLQGWSGGAWPGLRESRCWPCSKLEVSFPSGGQLSKWTPQV